MFGINEISGFSIINTTTGETVLEGDYLKSEPIKRTVIKNDEIKYPKIHNKDISITLSNMTVDKELLETMTKDFKEKPRSVKMIADIMSCENMLMMTSLGFKLYPIKRNKNKRIQKKWNKKYGFRCVRDINVDNIEFDKNMGMLKIN